MVRRLFHRQETRSLGSLGFDLTPAVQGACTISLSSRQVACTLPFTRTATKAVGWTVAAEASKQGTTARLRIVT
jgi:hypothetical protein